MIIRNDSDTIEKIVYTDDINTLKFNSLAISQYLLVLKYNTNVKIQIIQQFLY